MVINMNGSIRPSQFAAASSSADVKQEIDNGFEDAVQAALQIWEETGDRVLRHEEISSVMVDQLQTGPAELRIAFEQGYAMGMNAICQKDPFRLEWQPVENAPRTYSASSPFGGHYTLHAKQAGREVQISLWVPGQSGDTTPFAQLSDFNQVHLVAQSHFDRQVAEPFQNLIEQARIDAGLIGQAPSREDWLEAEVARLKGLMEQAGYPPPARMEKAEKLLAEVETFVEYHEITCLESISQRDSIAVTMTDFITDLVAMTGCQVARDYDEEALALQP